MLRRTLLRSAFASLAASILLSNPASAQESATLILDWVPDGSYASFFAGVDQGFYKEAGIAVPDRLMAK